MNERCPLSSGSFPGFTYQEDIPEICSRSCEVLWDAAISAGASDHEEYPDYIVSNPECPHPVTEHGNSSLQAVAVGSSVRLYGTTERCMSCDDEIAEDSYQFDCPNT